jgi:hypothetical protein
MSERVYSTIIVGQSHYSAGKKYCRRADTRRADREKVRAKKKLIAVV